ncbi:hypothetical protein C7S17_2097 [Burkholderia thailandensis]|nr:hypothetical protein [Burkholderia thailandensis]
MQELGWDGCAWRCARSWPLAENAGWCRQASASRRRSHVTRPATRAAGDGPPIRGRRRRARQYR